MRGEDGPGPYDDDDEDWSRKQRGSTSTNNCNLCLRFYIFLSERGQVLKIWTHASMEKTVKFRERMYRFNEALEWIKTFT